MRKPIGITVPYRKVGCVQHDCEKCKQGWVGLTTGEKAIIVKMLEKGNFLVAISAIEEKLKERNT